jgi:hypothetical protein
MVRQTYRRRKRQHTQRRRQYQHNKSVNKVKGGRHSSRHTYRRSSRRSGGWVFPTLPWKRPQFRNDITENDLMDNDKVQMQQMNLQEADPRWTKFMQLYDRGNVNYVQQTHFLFVTSDLGEGDLANTWLDSVDFVVQYAHKAFNRSYRLEMELVPDYGRPAANVGPDIHQYLKILYTVLSQYLTSKTDELLAIRCIHKVSDDWVFLNSSCSLWFYDKKANKNHSPFTEQNDNWKLQATIIYVTRVEPELIKMGVSETTTPDMIYSIEPRIYQCITKTFLNTPNKHYININDERLIAQISNMIEVIRPKIQDKLNKKVKYDGYKEMPELVRYGV